MGQAFLAGRRNHQIRTKTVLHLHMDGADTSTTFPDKSNSNHTVTANGNAQVDTAESQFTGASLLVQGTTSDYLSIPDSNDWTFAGDFSVECWVRPTSIPATFDITIIGYVSGAGGGWGDIGWNIKQQTTGATYFQASNNGGTGIVLAGTTAMVLDEWSHVSVSRRGVTTRLFLNGELEASTTSVWVSLNDTFTTKIGWGENIADAFDGHIDEVRVISGLSLNTTPFEPDVSAFAI